MANGNGVKFFKKDDPIIYKIKDILRLITVAIFIIGAVLVKPTMEKFKAIEEKQTTFQTEMKETKDTVAEIKTEQAVMKNNDEHIVKALEEIKADVKFLVNKNGGK